MPTNITGTSGTSGDDTLTGSSSSGVLHGLDGDDTLIGGETPSSDGTEPENTTPENTAPDAPADGDAAANAVLENAAAGTVVGITALATDPDGDAVSYSLTDDAGGRFTIDAATGVVTVADGSLLDHEAGSSHTIVVAASDGSLTTTQAMTIDVGNVNEAPADPTDSDGAANTVAENAVTGTVVGVTALAADPDAGDAVTYSLTDDAGGRFAIDAATGVVTVADGSLLDYEAAASHAITVKATDAGGLTSEQSFTIGVANVAEETYTGTAGDDVATAASAPLDRWVMNGLGGNDTLTGSAQDDTLTGGAGGDVLDGGAGDDLFLVSGSGDGFDAVTGGAGSDTIQAGANGTIIGLTGVSGVEAITANGHSGVSIAGNGAANALDFSGTTLTGIATIDGGAGADTITGSSMADRILGGADSDSLSGGDGNDTLDGGAGADTLDGGAGIDTATYAASASWVVVDLDAGRGLNADADGDVLTGIENATGSAYDDVLGGNAGANLLAGNAGNDILIGGAGADTLNGGAGIDTAVYGDSAAAVSVNLASGQASGGEAVGDQFSGIENVIGSAFNDTLVGNAGANALDGGNGHDTLDGGAGADSLTGGLGNDTYVVDAAGDVVTEGAGEGTDTVRTTLGSYTLTAEIEVLTYEGGGGFAGTGNTLDNLIQGGSGNDTLDGGGGTDTLIGGAGTDIASYASAAAGVTVNLSTGVNGGDAVGDLLSGIEIIAGSNHDDSLVGDGGNNVFQGGSGNDTLLGGAGADTLDGGAGADSLAGGAGNDTYHVDSAGDVVAEAASEGTDTVRTTLASYTLGANVENLVYDGGDGFAGTGNTLNNLLQGGAAVDALVGGAGNDTLDGGIGGGDLLDGGAGIDTVTYASSTSAVYVDLTVSVMGPLNGGASWDTVVGAENLIGSAYSDALAGSGTANLLDGGDGNDTLTGGAGADTLTGGAGTDMASYANAAAGVIVNLSTGVHGGDAGGDLLSGIEIIAGSGFGDSIVGDAGGNTLQGSGGNDTLVGGAGADTLDGGYETDTASYITATGAVSINLATGVYTGDASGDVFYGIEIIAGSNHNDVLVGDDYNNSFQGGAGNDTLDGGYGSDLLDGGAGLDTVTYATAASAVYIDLTTGWAEGAAKWDSLIAVEGLVGSAYDDLLVGNAATNTLDGGAGNDSLIGGIGADTLIGGAGTDIASYSTAAGAVTLNLSNGVHGGDAAGDQFSGIEIIVGSNHGDGFTGDAGANSFQTGSGNDTLTGGAGADTLDGGGDTDTASYATAAAAVTIDLATGVFTGDASGDVLLNIEVIAGSNHNDVLTGDGNNNSLLGGAGNDTLDGGQGGGDLLDGGAGIDTATYANATGAVHIDLTTGGAEGAAKWDSLVAIENLVGTAYDDVLVGNASANALDGGAGNDTLIGAVGADTLIGGAGNDVFYVDAANDVMVEAAGGGTDTVRTTLATYTLTAANVEVLAYDGGGAFTGTGSASDNVIQGGGANDTLIGGAGADTLDGGGGFDTASYVSSTMAISLNLATGAHSGDATGDQFVGIEVIAGSNHGDSFTGDAAANWFQGGAGNDTLAGGAGADTLDGGIGADMASYATATTAITLNLATGVHTGDAAGDQFIAIETIAGTNHDDSFTGDAAANRFQGGAGNDTLIGGAGADTLDGETGTDTASYITAASGVTINLGTGGRAGDASGDVFLGIEIIAGSNHNDFLTGDGGNNTFLGGAGNDTLDGGSAGGDLLDGGDGIDTASWASSTSGVYVNLTVPGMGPLHGGASWDTIVNIENLTGSNYADALAGDAGANALSGGGGVDTLNGGDGADTLTGGAGADVFQFLTTAESALGAEDLLSDFSQAAADRIDLSGIDADVLGYGNQAFTFIGTGAFTGAAGELRYTASGGNTLILGDVDGGGVADFGILVQGSFALRAVDFAL